VVLKSGRLLRGAFGVSTSDLGPAVEVGLLYPHFSMKQLTSLLASPMVAATWYSDRWLLGSRRWQMVFPL
jgi:hypothetical protein